MRLGSRPMIRQMVSTMWVLGTSGAPAGFQAAVRPAAAPLLCGAQWDCPVESSLPPRVSIMVRGPASRPASPAASRGLPFGGGERLSRSSEPLGSLRPWSTRVKPRQGFREKCDRAMTRPLLTSCCQQVVQRLFFRLAGLSKTGQKPVSSSGTCGPRPAGREYLHQRFGRPCPDAQRTNQRGGTRSWSTTSTFPFAARASTT